MDRGTNEKWSEIGIPFEYRKSTPEQFQRRLESVGLSPESALDFTEQLLIFEYFGQIYASHNFIQAHEVGFGTYLFAGKLRTMLTTNACRFPVYR